MQPNTKTFNNLYQATLKLATKFRTHTWLDNNRSIDECEAAIKKSGDIHRRWENKYNGQAGRSQRKGI